MSVTFIVDLVSGTFVQLSVKHYLIHSRWIVVYCSLVLPGPEPARGTESMGCPESDEKFPLRGANSKEAIIFVVLASLTHNSHHLPSVAREYTTLVAPIAPIETIT